MSAAAKRTIKAPIMEPRATPNEVEAAPPAAGASGAPVGLPVGLLPVRVAEPDCDIEVTEMLAFGSPVNDALGPIALLLTVLTAPVIVAKLDCTLAMATLLLDAATAELELGVGFCGNVTWMRISSH